MFESPTANFHHQVLELYDRYRTQRDACLTGSNRLLTAATALAIALYHFGEQFDVATGAAKTSLPKCKIVEELANAAKHGKRKRGRQTYIADARSLFECNFITEYSDDEGPYYHCEVRVIARCMDGTELDVDGPIIEYLNQWIDYLHQNGYIENVTQKPAAKPGSSYVKRDEAKSADYEVNRQVGVSGGVMCLQRFDPSRCASTPIDITGSTIQFSLFAAPKVELVLKVGLPNGGPELVATIILSADEASRLEAATGLGLRDAMMDQLKRDHSADLQAQLQKAYNALDWNKPAT